MPSNRATLIAGLRDRLRSIESGDTYETDLGQAVFLNELPDTGEGDPEQAVVIVIGTDQPRYQGEQIYLDLPIEFQAIAKADLADPYLAAEAVLADIKRAIELPDRTVGGLVKRQIERGPTRTLPREPGSLYVGIAIAYTAPYVEVWGNP